MNEQKSASRDNINYFLIPFLEEYRSWLAGFNTSISQTYGQS
jgi:hypothetical protein